MAIIANTFQRYQAIGIREELAELISNIAPTETPFQSNAGKCKVSNTLFEWQLDTLAATAANAQIEGDDVGSTFEAVVPTVRVGNYTQISRKTVIIAGTEEVINKAGRKSELAYQLVKKGQELKRDMEAIFLANTAAAVGATGTARTTGSLLAFIKTNVDKAGDGTNPVYASIPVVRVDGTLRNNSETILKNVIQLAWSAGASPSTVMVGALQKQAISQFAGIATKFKDVGSGQATITGAADVYVSDFGTVQVVPNRFQRARDMFVLDFDYIEIATLRPLAKVELAKTGDAEKRMLIVEYGLKVKNEAALGLAADVQ